jgi:hypothetical protein
VVCPSCGHGNQRSVAERYRVCVRCGTDLGPALARGPGEPVEVGDPAMGDMTRPDLEGPPGVGVHPGQPGQPSYGGPGPTGPYPPTFHPGVYERPQRRPYVDLGNLFRLLFHPREAFEDLYDHTGSSQGVVVAITLILLTAGISAMMMFFVLGNLEVPEDVGSIPGTGAGSATQLVIDVIMGLVLFFVSAYLVFTLLKGRARRPSMERTLGMMGYAKFPFFIIGILVAVYTPYLIQSLDVEGLDDEDPDVAMDAFRSLCGSLTILYGMMFVGFIWGLWVHSHAQSVANDVALGTAFGYVFITWIIAGAISFTVGLLVATFMIGSAL